MSTNSPSRARLEKLSYKLDTREPLIKNDKGNKVDTLEERCHQLQEKMGNYLETNNKEIKAIKEQIVKVKDMLAQEKASREAVLESRYRDVAAIENRVARLVENEMQAKQESDYKLTNLINQRNNELKEYLRKETAIREENINLLNATLESDLPKLSESIKTEQNEQAEADTEILKKCQEQVNVLKEFVNKERKDREDSERTIQEMLRNVFNKVKEDIELEKKGREATEESLMTLLEETCKKVADAGHL